MPSDLDWLAAWRDAVAERGAVRAIARSPQFYLEHYPHHEQEVAA